MRGLAHCVVTALLLPAFTAAQLETARPAKPTQEPTTIAPTLEPTTIAPTVEPTTAASNNGTTNEVSEEMLLRSILLPIFAHGFDSSQADIRAHYTVGQ